MYFFDTFMYIHVIVILYMLLGMNVISVKMLDTHLEIL